MPIYWSYHNGEYRVWLSDWPHDKFLVYSRDKWVELRDSIFNFPELVFLVEKDN